MTDVLSYVLLALGIVLMVSGYRRNNRNMLVWAGLILCLGGGINEFVHGFVDGIHAGGAPA
jgi:hypothetical protein